MKLYLFNSSGQTGAKKKIERILKLITVYMLVVILQVNAAGFAQQKITLAEKNKPLEHVLNKIKTQTGINLLYVLKDIKLANPVTIAVKEAKLEDVLKQVFANQPLTYTIDLNSIVVKRRTTIPVSAQASENQEINVSGKVLDETGQGVPGVTVKVKGTTQGTLTAPDGRFAFKNLSPDAILSVSYIGYNPQEVPVLATEMTIRLVPQNSDLNEVVVVGYGTQKKVNLTGSIAVVKGEALENRPVANATQSLQGLAPGLNVAVGGNTKPGQSFNLNIRGAGNLSGGDGPFVLVDGMAMSLSDVNPNDIESISVLKDAAASAIYGARAPYGVILVTTKKGSSEKSMITYSGNLGLTSPLRLPEMANSYEFAKYFNAATFNATGSRQYSDEKLALLEQYVQNPAGMNIFPEVSDNFYSNWENSANGVANTDWFKFHYKPLAVRQNHNLSASGGNKTTQYFISGGFYNEGGSLRYADINYKRYNLAANITTQLTSWAKLKLNTKYTQEKYVSPLTAYEGEFYHNLARMRPNVSPYDLNGNFSEMSNVPYLQSGSKDENNTYTLAILPGLEVEPIKNWKINVDMNLRRTNRDQDLLNLPGLIYGIDGTPKYVNRSEYNIPLLGGYSRDMNVENYASPNVFSSYKFTVKENHNFSVLAGFQQELNQYKRLISAAQDLISPDRPGLSLTTGAQSTREARTHWATRGVFGRFNYDYKNKYLVEINGRYDGSSRFASDSRWGFFPSASLGYNIAQESFMDGIKEQLSMLKLRASYGVLGNQAGAGLYSFAQTMNIRVPVPTANGNNWYFQNGREGYIAAPDPFNPLVTWEKVHSANIGIDFEMLKSRLSGNFDVFSRSTKDMLGPSLDIADFFGGTPPLSNNANLRTRGWELALNWRDTFGNGIRYSLGAMLSDNKSYVTKYQNPTFNNPGDASSWYEGKQTGEIWGYKTGGLIQNAAEAAEYNKLNHSFLSPLPWVAGDVNYLDLNGDGKVDRGNNRVGDMGDQTIIGNTTPRYAYTFSGSIEWKGLSLSVLFQGIGKMNYAPRPGDVYFWGSGALAQVTVFDQHLDYWTPENTGAYYPNPYASPAGSINTYMNKTQQVSDQYLQNAAYLRLKNVTLNYAIPSDFLKKIKLSRANVFISGENLFTITKLAKMLDPEMLVSTRTAGKAYPLSKVYSLGMNVSF